MSFSSIPVVDFQRLQDPRTKEEALAQLREAIFIVGFLYLTNHGLEVRSLQPIRRLILICPVFDQGSTRETPGAV